MKGWPIAARCHLVCAFTRCRILKNHDLFLWNLFYLLIIGACVCVALVVFRLSDTKRDGSFCTLLVCFMWKSDHDGRWVYLGVA